jgi:cell division protein FtsW
MTPTQPGYQGPPNSSLWPWSRVTRSIHGGQTPMGPMRLSYRTDILVVTGILTSLGLLAVFSASSVPAFHRTGDVFHFVRKQALVSVVGFSLIACLQWVPLKWFERATLPLYLGSILLIWLTLVPSLQHSAKGAARWLNTGMVTFQPAELAKLGFIFFLAKNLARAKVDLGCWRHVMSNVIAFSFLALPLMLQPDFGTTFLLFAIAFLMLFAAGLPWRYTFTGIGLGLMGIAAAIVYAPYRLARMMAFLDPWKEVQRGGFQIIQSYLGFQNGGMWGLGAGQSRQRLYFLPEAHTDFIVAVIGEEYGLPGVILVIICFAVLIQRGLVIAAKQKRTYTKLLAIGLTSLIAAQASINMGVAMGVLPTKGISLPLVSSGASSLLVFLLVIGCLCRLDQGEFSNRVKQ